MSAFVVLVVFGAACYGLGFVVGRRDVEERDRGWLRPERRRWRP